MREFLCIAHRGARGHAPENTLLAVENALSLNADWIEVDVYCVEDELIVIHDETLDRTTNGNGPVASSSLDYIRSLDAGGGEKVPFLREVLDLVAGRLGVNVELKGPGTASKVAELIERYVVEREWVRELFILSDTDPEDLAEVKRVQPSLQTGLLVSPESRLGIHEANTLGAYSIHPHIDCVTPALIEDAHASDLRVFPYTVNDPERIAHLKKIGADGVFTDYPELVT